ncbi:MAG: LacI family DNA-binding transcriptional regulator [Chloroflexi bacterium]|nr:LacI family DNA-binding transcriptional regulator [Chloroflexota bacterium]
MSSTGGSRPATLRDVAAHADVDVSVVSRVVNGDPRLRVSDATRERVERSLRILDYRPNVQARGLRLARTWTIGFVLPDLMNPFYAPIVEGAEQRASELGYMVVIVRELDRARADDPELAFARLLHEDRVDGLLVASGRVDDDVLRTLDRGRRPLVIVNRRVPGVAGSVVVDDQAAAEVATSHLIDLGHRRLGHVAGPSGIDNTLRRHAGVAAAAARGGAMLVTAHGEGWDPESGHTAALRLLATHDVTGVVATNIIVAAGVVGAAQELGRRVPEDLSVVALHDFPVAPFLRPSLTTVVLPLEELGRQAVDELMWRLAGNARREITIAGRPRLVLRDSAGPPRDEGVPARDPGARALDGRRVRPRG